MDCFTSPTRNRLSPWDRAAKMAFCTALVSWYSSTMISRYSFPASAARGDGPPSSPVSRAAVRCSPSAKSMSLRFRFRAVNAPSNRAVTSSRAHMAGPTARRSSMTSAAPTSNRSPSLLICFRHSSRWAVMRAFNASSCSPRFIPGRGKGTGKQAAAGSHPARSPSRSRSSPSRVSSRVGP